LLTPALLLRRTAFFMTTSPFTLNFTVTLVEQTVCLRVGCTPLQSR